jgi:hypothetical protein
MKDGVFIEHGDWAAGGQGTRNDLRAVMKLIDNNTSTLHTMIAEPDTYSKHIKFVEKYRAAVEHQDTKTFRNVEVEVLCGPPGCGKTRAAHERFPDIFTVNCEDAFPFDGYDGERQILIDDFDGNMKYHQLLRVLDGHQYRCNVKGGHRYAKWTHIIITSNYKPEFWYRQGMTGALQRRLKSVTDYETRWGGNTVPPTHVDLYTGENERI